MRACESGSLTRRIDGDEGFRDRGRRRFESGKERNRSCGRCAAEGAVLEMRMRSCVRSRVVVVQVGARHRRRIDRGTQFQQERGSARRHEADRHVGAEQQQGQHDAGQ